MQEQLLGRPHQHGREVFDAPRGMSAQPATGGIEAPQTERTEVKKIREIAIQAMDSGYVVSVGCKSFAISTTTELLNRLGDYMRNPAAVERLFEEGKLFL